MGFGFEGILARAVRRSGGHPERHRHRPLESVDRSVRAAPTTAPTICPASGKRSGSCWRARAWTLPTTGLRRPLIGLVSRLTDQKGFDLIAAAIDELMALDAAWVMLGSGERRYEQLWNRLPERFPGRVSDARSASTTAWSISSRPASDAFLMPSRFEPCGLNQLNSLRYGTLPIVRATGGLDAIP